MPLSWDIVLNDKGFTATSNKAAASLQVLQSGIQQVTINLGQMENKSGESAASLLKLGAVIGSVTALTTKAISAIDNFADSAVKSFGERTAAIRAYTTLLGDSTKAELEFYRAQQLSQKTDFTSASIEKGTTQLISAGFRDRDLQAARLAAADIASIAENKDMALGSAIRAFGQIKSKGKLQTEELMQLAEGAGLSIGGVKDELAKMMKVKDRGAVDKLLQGGKVSGDVGIVAIEKAIMTQLHTSRLGEFATQSSGSLTGLVSNQQEAWQNLAKSFDSEVLPGVKRYKESLAEQTNALSVASKAGQGLSITYQSFADTSLNLKTTWTQFVTSFVTSFSESYNAVIKELGLGEKQWNATGDAAKNFGQILGQVGSILAYATAAADALAPAINVAATAFQYIGNVIHSVGEFVGIMAGAMVDTLMHPTHAVENFKNALAAGTEVGAAVLGKGTQIGIGPNGINFRQQGDVTVGQLPEYAPIGADEDYGPSKGGGTVAGERFGKDFIAGARAATQTHSPSEEMRRFGLDLRAGLMLGLNAGGSAGATTVAGAGTSVGEINVIVQAAGSGGSPEAIGAAVRDALARLLGDIARNPQTAAG